MEANPGTTSPESLAICRQAGFNRISFGLQSASPRLLRSLGRIHDADDFVRSVRMAAAAGYDRISADIMFGLPDQDEQDLDETLQLIFSLPINHVSFYGLILEEGTPLHEAYHRRPGSVRLPDDEEERSQYHLIRHQLAARGFGHYEISNSAQPGQQCRHNLVYWRGLPYMGFGVAAHSYLAGMRRANPTTLEEYAGTWQPEVLERVSQDEGMKEMLLLGLRLVDGVSADDFYGRFGRSLDERFPNELGDLQTRGLIVRDHGKVRLSERGLDLANQVFQAFI
jgi:oxygen-independent coproporphyrinogen-3 oxidase